MIELEQELNAPAGKAFLVGFQRPEEDGALIASQLEELAELVRNVNVIPLEPEIVRLRAGSHPKYGIGTGKAEEIAQLARECEADLLVFDSPLSPSQQRNWERLFGGSVVGREEIILDIFASRAHTKEAVLQIELAKMEYALPRLKRAWSHLSRQRGGGTTNRGEGEAQIESDRRLLRRRIQQLKEELLCVRRQRASQRKSRLRRPVLQAAIVGYTNVGKSSLLRALTGAEIYVQDQLFATLDPTARRLSLGGNCEMVLTDTVGFVRKLPHQLVEAFKSTLEEATFADLLLLVLDLSSPDIDMEWETTLGVLKELGADETKIQVVFNKCDLVDKEKEAVKLARLRGLFPRALYVSSVTGENLDSLKTFLSDFAGQCRKLLKAKIPSSRFDLISLAHRAGEIYEEEFAPDGTASILFAVDAKMEHLFKEFLS